MTPTNPFPFPVYPLFMHSFNLQYILTMHFTSAVTDFKNYDKPITMFLGLPELHQYSLEKQQINKIKFQHIHIKTWDGFLRKSLREDRGMLFKNASYRNKIRTLMDPVQVMEIELSDQVLQVERVYPNIINLCSDIGSILKVLVFLCIATGMIHNQILLDMYLLNSIFSTETMESSRGQDNAQQYSYWNIVALKYCCQSKKNLRKQKYDHHMQIISQRMDMLDLVKRTQNSDFLTNAIFEPYQREVLSNYKEQNDNQIKNVNDLTLQQALMDLENSQKNNQGDYQQRQIDQIIQKLISKNSSHENTKNNSRDEQDKSVSKGQGMNPSQNLAESQSNLLPRAIRKEQE